MHNGEHKDTCGSPIPYCWEKKEAMSMLKQMTTGGDFCYGALYLTEQHYNLSKHKNSPKQLLQLEL